MRTFILTLLLVALSFSWSCQDPLQSEPNYVKYENFFTLDNQASNVIMPLKIGNEWVFDRISYDDDGNPIQDENITDSIYIENEILDKREIVYLVKNTFGFCDGAFTNKTNGLWRICDPPQLEAKYPGQKGQTYSYEGEKYPSLVDTGGGYRTTYSISEHHYEILSTNTVININGHNYTTYVYEQTYHIHLEGQSKEDTDIHLMVYPKYLKYYCPGIGPIKVEYYERKYSENEFKLKYISTVTDYILK